LLQTAASVLVTELVEFAPGYAITIFDGSVAGSQPMPVQRSRLNPSSCVPAEQLSPQVRVILLVAVAAVTGYGGPASGVDTVAVLL